MELAHRTRGVRRITEYYRKLHQPGTNPETSLYRLTPLGAWAGSRAEHVHYFFKTIKVDRFRLFLDLGSGDGLVTCIAGLYTRAVGIEVDLELVRLAQRASEDLDLRDRVGFVCGDYRQMRICNADCLYIYPDKPLGPIEALLEGWAGQLLVYGPHFPPKSLLPTLSLKCGSERLKVYERLLCTLPHS